jgi:DNA-directed RNA polymerase specialized sigma24 family protein
MGRPPVKIQPAVGDFLSADEINDAFDALSPDDKLKLAAIEAIRRRGTAYARTELISEAVSRILGGVRRCPRDVPPVALIAQTMRSVASHARKQRQREAPSADEELLGAGADRGSVIPLPAAPSPEDILMEKQNTAAVQAIYGCFDDDAEAQLVLMGWQDDLRGVALREATGLDQGQLDYAIKRIRIRMRKAYPDGWQT